MTERILETQQNKRLLHHDQYVEETKQISSYMLRHTKFGFQKVSRSLLDGAVIVLVSIK